MILKVEECIKILEQPADPNLEKAVYHEDRVRLHTESTLEQPDNPAYNEFIGQVKRRIPDDAYDRFVSLIEFPFATVDYTEGVFSSFQRVFEAPDRYVNISFTNPDYNQDFQPFISDVDKWFKEYGVSTLKTKFNSYVVVDLPKEQTTERPEPYFYCLPVCNVLRVKINRKNKCEYIAFDTGEKYGEDKLIAFFDDQHYRIFIEKGGKYRLFEGEQGTGEVVHGLGWCPASPFWSDVLDATKTMINKKMPATNSLGRLTTLAFKLISKEYSDLYNLYPIIWSLPEAEDEKRVNEQFDREGGIDCVGDQPVTFNKSNSNKILTNPGRYVIKPLPDNEMGDPGDPMGFIAPPVPNLEFIQKDLEVRKETIQFSIAGKPGEPKNDQAKNEKQVSAGFESEYNVLLNASWNFAEVMKFIIKTQAALRYGPETVKEVSVNNGRNFFLHTHKDIMEEMKMAKDTGMPSYIVDQQEKAFIQTKYRTNPEKQERMEIIRNLFPYPNMSDMDVVKNASILAPEKVRIRLEFFDLLNEFERKFAPVEVFVRDQFEIDDRIRLIKEEFQTIIKSNNYGSITEPSGAVPGVGGQESRA